MERRDVARSGWLTVCESVIRNLKPRLLFSHSVQKDFEPIVFMELFEASIDVEIDDQSIARCKRFIQP